MPDSNRTVTITTPLGDGELVFYNLNGTESIGRLFEFEVELIREIGKGNVSADDLLGQDMTVKLDLPNGSTRYFNGETVEFRHTGLRNRYIVYRARLRPWLWYLSLTANCRIFQEKTVVDVIKAVLNDYSFADVEYQIDGSYETMDYCVQYRESDFDFISRLMEHDGLFYYFKHQDKKHTLVITDSNQHWQTINDYDTLPYYPAENSERRERDHIFEWLPKSRVTTGKYEQTDFDFESPSTDLTTKKQNPGAYKNNQLEVYDYPGKYTDTSVGTKLTDKRLEERQMPYSLKEGKGNAAGIVPGMKFTLEQHYFEEENAEHVIVSASYTVQGDDPASAMGGSGEIFQCSFSAIDQNQAYRSARLTEKPVISGSQTAIVVGKSGEEIWTDKYGRIKVQFHWDREGSSDENSSCWVRVSQPMAGKKWGWISLPRMGQEVVVSFLEGDPDRPLITGRVYNDEQMPPYELPANQTQSGIKTRSSKDGTAENFNEIRFEDKKGEEELYVHAEKNYTRIVENDETVQIGADKKDKGDQTVDIHNNRTVTLAEGTDTLTIEKGDRLATLDKGDDTLKIKMGDHLIDISAGKSTITAAKSIELKVGGSSIKLEPAKITIKSTMINIEGSATVDVKGAMTTVKGSGMLTLQGGLTKIN